MKPLIEQVEAKFITEENEGRKRLYIEGVFLQSEVPNRNKRRYPKSIMEREVSRYIKERVEDRRAWGELGHPASPNINLDRACIRIVSLKEDGNDYIGKALVLNTEHGKIVQSLIEDGGNLGVSSRGMGSLKMCEGINIVQDDYHLATAADVVADPSAPDAFVTGLMEGKEWIWNNTLIDEEEVDRIYQEIKNAKKRDLEESMLKAFTTYMNKL